MSINQFVDSNTQAISLARKIREDVLQLLWEQEFVVISVPGGNTPKLFYELFFAFNLPWGRIFLVLNDERWVPFNSARSNEAMLYRIISQSDAMLSNRVALYHSEKAISDQAKELTQKLFIKGAIDICVLGMGDDGHFASLFPGMNNLESALSLAEDPAIIVAEHPLLDEPRVSLNLSAIATARHHYLLISGRQKLNIFQNRDDRKEKRMPIDHLIAEVDIQVYYTD